MKKILTLVLLIIAFAVMIVETTGCTSTSAEWGGERIVENKDGTPLVANDGTVQKVKEPVRLKSLRHWMDTHVDAAKLHVKDNEIEFEMNNYTASTTTNLAGLVSAGFDGGARLATAIGDAYVKIAGGGAQADTALSVAQKVYAFFRDKGGDASAATVTTSDGKMRVSDGSTCIECDAAGNCTTCSDL